MEEFQADLGFIEGPVVCQDGSIVVTSIDRGRLYRIADGKATVLAVTGGGPNGATQGGDGRIYVTQNGGAWPALNEVKAASGIQVVDRNGDVSVVTDCPRSPNDLAFGPDGLLYFTDPTRKPERDDGRIFRCDVATGACELLITCDWYPNGIGFSAEDDWFYVADSRNKRIVRFPIDRPEIARMEVVLTLDHGSPDGFAFDCDGNLVIACVGPEGQAGDVQVWTPDWRLKQVIAAGSSRYYTNLAISPDGTLFLCNSSTGHILSSRWSCPGLALHPFR